MDTLNERASPPLEYFCLLVIFQGRGVVVKALRY